MKSCVRTLHFVEKGTPRFHGNFTTIIINIDIVILLLEAFCASKVVSGSFENRTLDLYLLPASEPVLCSNLAAVDTLCVRVHVCLCMCAWTSQIRVLSSGP